MADEPWRPAVDAAWDRIEAWYLDRGAGHLLRPGATDEDLLKVEARLRRPLPASLRASLQRHNGSRTEGWARGTLLSCGAVVAATELWRRVADHGEDVQRGYVCPDAERGLLRPGWWHTGWIAFDEDPLGNATAIDTDPGPEGAYGQVLEMDRLTGPIHSADDLAAYLSEVAGALDDFRVVQRGFGQALEERDVWEGDGDLRAIGER